MTFKELDIIRKGKYGEFDNDAIRVRRAISWGMAAENAKGDDEKFIFYWIALNAAYANETYDELVSRHLFFSKISSLDNENRIKKSLMEIPNQLRVFVDNKYLYKKYWESLDGDATKEEFEQEKTRITKIIYSGLMSKEESLDVLNYLFNLIYILRIQIFHGLATYKSKVNREQLIPCVKILEATMPIIIELLLEHNEIDWGEVSYPYVNQNKK